MQKPAREQGRYTQCNLPHARLPQRPLRGFASRPSRFLLSGFNRKGRKEFRKVRKDAVANSPSWLLRCPRSCQNLRAIATGFHQCRSLRVSNGVTLSATSRTPAFLSDLCVALTPHVSVARTSVRYCLGSQTGKAVVGSKGRLFLMTPNAICRSFRIAAQTICIGVLPLSLRRMANVLMTALY